MRSEGAPATRDSVRAHMEAIRSRQGWGGARAEEDRAALGRPCPHCHAGVNQWCSSRTGRHRPQQSFIHERRLK